MVQNFNKLKNNKNMINIGLYHAAREWAMQYLYQIEVNNDLKEDSLEFFWQQLSNHSSVKEKKIKMGKILAEKFIHGVLEHKDEFDSIIEKFSQNWSLKRIALIDLTILRLALYEINYSKTPRIVAISEAIKLAKGFSEKKSISFVNGILDKIN